MEPRPPAASHATLVKWMGITDASSVGFIHGGTVMKLSDEAAGIAAVKHSRRRVVTASVGQLTSSCQHSGEPGPRHAGAAGRADSPGGVYRKPE